MPRSIALFLSLCACTPTWLPPDVQQAPLGRQVVVHPDTVLLDDAVGLQEIVVHPHGLAVRADRPLDLRVGNVVVGRQGGGYLRRIAAITPRTDGVWLDTVPASLSEALLEASITEHVALDPRRSGARWDLSGAVLLDETVGTAPNLAHARVALDDGAFVAVEPAFDFALDVFSSDATFSIDTSVRVDAEASIVATADGTVDLTEEVPLASQSIPFEFWIGPVPVVGVATVDVLGRVELEADGAATAALRTSAVAEGTFAAGYAGDWWSDADVTFDVDVTPDAPTLDGHVRARAALVARVSTTLYGTATPSVDVVPWVEAASCPGGLAVDAGVDGSLACTADVFGWEVASFGPEPFAFGPWDVASTCD